jgi:glycosyltransferase involved in cell wall biosynthesis
MSVRRVALMGPLPPYRGGIARVGGRLAAALSRRVEVDRVTFSRQYPRTLLPGRTQLEPGDDPGSPPAQRLLDSLDPRSWRRTGRFLAEREPGAVLLSHWQPFFVPACLGTLRALRSHARRAPHVSLLLHTVRPHEPFPGSRALVARLLRRADSAVALSATVASQVRAIRPELPLLESAHPAFDDLPDAPPREEARRKLGLPARPTLLFFGFVRSYKGVDVLLDALPRVWERVDAQLVVAGEAVAGGRRLESRLRDLDARETRLTWRPGYASDAEVSLLFGAADAVVLPYRAGVQSGVLETAFAYGRPVVATHVGAFAEDVREGKDGLLVPPEDAGALAEAIVQLLSGGAERLAPAARARGRERSFDDLAARLLHFWSKAGRSAVTTACA